MTRSLRQNFQKIHPILIVYYCGLLTSLTCLRRASASNNGSWNEYYGSPGNPPPRRDERRPDVNHKGRESEPEWWQDTGAPSETRHSRDVRPTAPSSEYDDGTKEYRSNPHRDQIMSPTAPPSQFDDADLASSQQQYSGSRPSPPKEAYAPIHYQFQSKSKVDESLQQPGRNPGRRRGEAFLEPPDDTIPATWTTDDDRQARGDDQMQQDRSGATSTASPRRDAVTRYMSTTKGRLLLRISSGAVGYSTGAFVGKSLISSPHSVGIAACLLFVACTFFRNPYGELSRALGLALIYALRRTHGIRRRYPSWPQIQACVGAGPRRPFPRSENPWKSDEQEPFQMMYTLVAMAVVGSMCGGNLPVIPTWMGALGGAGFFAFITTIRSARGDLARTMGMRVVALVEEVFDINAELRVVGRFGVVSGKIFDKLMILDRKHRIKDKIVSVVSWGYNQVSRTASQVQSDMQEEEGRGRPGDDRRGDTRDDGRRSDDSSDTSRRGDDQRYASRRDDRNDERIGD